MAAAPHFLVLPLPTFGHINPMLHLSVQLASMRHRVTFITTSNTLIIQVLDVEQGSLEELNQSGMQGTMANAKFMAEQAGNLDNLIVRICEEQGALFTCMILDLTLADSLKPLASKRNIPVALQWTASAALLLFLLELPRLLSRGYIPRDFMKDPPIIISDIPGLPKLCSYKDVPMAFQRPIPGDPDYSKTLHSTNSVRKSHLVLINTFDELEHQALRCIRRHEVNAVPIGPLLSVYKSEEEEPDKSHLALFEWLDSKPALSVLYVSFGSLGEVSEEQLKELATALQISGCNFLWVIRENQKLKNGPLEEFKLTTADRGLVVPWCSQLQVLQHSSVGGFITHCGWNSMLESIACGVPMIGWPCFAEQHLNSKFLVDVWKIGMRILAEKVDGSLRLVPSGEIVEAINSIMTNEDVRTNCQLWKQAAERAAEQSIHNLSSLQEFQVSESTK